MTRRDGDTAGKMATFDKGDNYDQNSIGNLEKELDLSDCETKPFATVISKQSVNSTRHHSSSSSTGNGAGTGDVTFPSSNSTRSYDTTKSLPGSRSGSRPGSRMHSRTNSQESIIDLFDCMTLTYGQNKSNNGQKGIQLVPGKGLQFVSPKPKQFRNQRWTWHDKVRINSAIWRAWHMQYIKGKRPVVCHFTAPVLEKQRLNVPPDVIQAGRGYTGSIHYNQSQVVNIVRDYRKWRVRSKDVLQTQAHQLSAIAGSGSDDEDRDVEENAIDLDMPHPPLSPMFARKLANDDMPLKDFSDTLFISTGKKFNVPHPKKITQHVYNADIIQPGLMQLEPDFDDDFMDTLESLTDILMKTPTKADLAGFNLAADFPTSFLNSDTLSSLGEAMEIASNLQVPTRVMQSDHAPATSVFPVSIQPSVPHQVCRNLSYTTTQEHTSTSQQQQSVVYTSSSQQHQHQQQNIFIHPSSSGEFVKPPVPQSMFVVTEQSGGRTSFTPLTETGVIGTQGIGAYSVSTVQTSGAVHTTGAPHSAVHTDGTVYTSAPHGVVYTSGAHGSMVQGGISAGGYDPNRVQGPTLMQALTGTYNITLPQGINNNPGFQQTLGGADGTGFTPIVSTATMSSQKVPRTISKVEPLSPTLSHRPSCDQMVVANEAIDVIAYQLPMSPSKMIPPMCTVEWNPPTQQGDTAANWANSLNDTTAFHIATPGDGSIHMNTQQQAFNRKPNFNNGGGGDLKLNTTSRFGDNMEYDAISPAVTPGSVTPGRVTPGNVTPGTVTPPYKPNKRDRDGNFSHSNSTSPRTVFGSQYSDSALHAALLRKSDVKDLGMLSPSSSEQRLESATYNPVSSTSYPSTAASSAASSPGTPHNELCEMPNQREFDFPGQKAKRQKTPDNSFEKETRRRLKHLKSEHKRRFNIQTGLDELQALVPSLKNVPEGSKISTVTLLVKAHEHIITLKDDYNDMKRHGEQLRADVETLNDEIGQCQDELPDSGAPVNTRNDRQLQSMLDAYVMESSNSNWKFWIFSFIVRPMFETYLNAVCDNPSTNFDTAVTEWIEEHCKLRTLRKVVLSALRQVSKGTSVLSDPSKLPDQVSEIVKNTYSGGPT